jgi:uncharacterized protein YlxW (UPF0749 family)
MITVFKPANVQVIVIDGDPPVDQSALVASLQSQVATLTGERDALQAKIAAARAAAEAAKAADAANVEGQSVLDALA